MSNKHLEIILKKGVAISCIIALVIPLIYLFIYMGGEIRGNINFHFLPAKMFGVPAYLEDKGIKPLYTAPGETGWDGQFYYYMASDPFDLRNTSTHLDSNVYRYQRIGFALVAKAISTILLMDWVPPFLYYSLYLFLIIITTYFLSSYLKKCGLSPYWALIWTLGYGTQLTLLNGLVDAAADCFLILSLIAYMNKKKYTYLLLISLAALTREAYILVAFIIGLSELIIIICRNKFPHLIGSWKEIIQKTYLFVIPGIIFIGWRTYLQIRYHVSPSQQAWGITDYPLRSLTKYIYLSFTGNHPIFSFSYKYSLIEGLSLVLFGTLLFTFLFVVFGKYKDLLKLRKEDIVIFSLLGPIVLYLFFGDTVMMHNTGYAKAANILYFGIPLFIANMKNVGRYIKYFIILLLISHLIFYNGLLVVSRLDIFNGTPSTIYTYSKYHDSTSIRETQSCINNIHSNLSLISMDNFYYNQIFRKARNIPDAMYARVVVSNLGEETYYKVNGIGGVRVSYQWLDSQGNIVKDGLRAYIQDELKPNESINVDMVIQYPIQKGKYTLIISLVQEGCTWFYLSNEGFITSSIEYKG